MAHSITTRNWKWLFVKSSDCDYHLYIYIYIYTHTHTFIHTDIYTYVYIHTSMELWIRARMGQIRHVLWDWAGKIYFSTINGVQRLLIKLLWPRETYLLNTTRATTVDVTQSFSTRRPRRIERDRRNCFVFFLYVGKKYRIQYTSFQASAAKLVRTVFFWYFTQRTMVVSYRSFGTAYRSHVQWSSQDPWRWDRYVDPKRR